MHLKRNNNNNKITEIHRGKEKEKKISSKTKPKEKKKRKRNCRMLCTLLQNDGCNVEQRNDRREGSKPRNQEVKKKST